MSLVILSGCSQRTAISPASQAAESPRPGAAAQSPTAPEGGKRPIFWEPVVGTEVFDLRTNAPFSPVIPGYLPTGYALQFWSVGLVSSGEILYGEDSPAAMVVTLLFGPAGKPNLVAMESKADLRLPTEAKVVRNGDGSEQWAGTSVLFHYDDVHLLVIGQGMAKEEVMKVVASMKYGWKPAESLP